MAEQVPDLQPVSSTNLAALGYDRASETLYVQWKNGQVSAYEGVPPSVASNIQSAPSVGKAFNETIKGQYQHRYLER